MVLSWLVSYKHKIHTGTCVFVSTALFVNFLFGHSVANCKDRCVGQDDADPWGGEDGAARQVGD